MKSNNTNRELRDSAQSLPQVGKHTKTACFILNISQYISLNYIIAIIRCVIVYSVSFCMFTYDSVWLCNLYVNPKTIELLYLFHAILQIPLYCISLRLKLHETCRVSSCIHLPWTFHIMPIWCLPKLHLAKWHQIKLNHFTSSNGTTVSHPNLSATWSTGDSQIPKLEALTVTHTLALQLWVDESNS